MNAYITLLSSEKYLEGVKILHRSLKAVKAKYPLFVVTSNDISNDIIQTLDNEGVNIIKLEKSIFNGNVNTEDYFFHWNLTFDKLQVFGLTEFSKCVFLDSDMLILKNIDELFELKDFSAVCAGKSFPGCEHWEELNSGLFVFTPSKKIEKDLILMANDIIKEYSSKNKPVGDQDVINQYIRNWKDRKELHLDECYNIFANIITYYIRHLGYSFQKKECKSDKIIRVVHFVGGMKPWMIKDMRSAIWLIRQILANPYYIYIYIRVQKLLKS